MITIQTMQHVEASDPAFYQRLVVGLSENQRSDLVKLVNLAGQREKYLGMVTLYRC